MCGHYCVQAYFAEFLSQMDVDFCQMFFQHLLRKFYYFILYFANVMCHIDWFVGIELSLYPCNKSNLIMVYDPFNIWLNLAC